MRIEYTYVDSVTITKSERNPSPGTYVFSLDRSKSNGKVLISFFGFSLR